MKRYKDVCEEEDACEKDVCEEEDACEECQDDEKVSIRSKVSIQCLHVEP